LQPVYKAAHSSRIRDKHAIIYDWIDPIGGHTPQSAMRRPQTTAACVLRPATYLMYLEF